MKSLYGPDEATVQSFCDRAHSYLLSHDADYAAAVAAGITKRWSKPLRELDETGKPIGGWFMRVNDACLPAFTAVELQGLV